MAQTVAPFPCNPPEYSHPVNVDRLTPAIGAEISGINLSRPLGDDRLEQVYRALSDHLVLFCPGQDLSAQHQLDFARTFGGIDKPHAIYPHVEGFQQVVLLENDGDRPPDTNAWHTDLTYYPRPPFASILHAREVPETGGDTLWASMYAAYDHLPASMKPALDNLLAIHDPGSFRNQFLGEDHDIEALNESLGRVGSAIHSMVKTHPVTGRKYLYVNRSFTQQVVDYGTTESDRLLNYLFDHINQPEYQVRHRWRSGDLVMWDNRVTQHYAVADYLPHYRRMHRVTVVNDRRANRGQP